MTQDTILLTYLTGEEVEIVRWALLRELEILEDMGQDLEAGVIKEVISRIP